MFGQGDVYDDENVNALHESVFNRQWDPWQVNWTVTQSAVTMIQKAFFQSIN